MKNDLNMTPEATEEHEILHHQTPAKPKDLEMKKKTRSGCSSSPGATRNRRHEASTRGETNPLPEIPQGR